MRQSIILSLCLHTWKNSTLKAKAANLYCEKRRSHVCILLRCVHAWQTCILLHKVLQTHFAEKTLLRSLGNTFCANILRIWHQNAKLQKESAKKACAYERGVAMRIRARRGGVLRSFLGGWLRWGLHQVCVLRALRVFTAVCFWCAIQNTATH